MRTTGDSVVDKLMQRVILIFLVVLSCNAMLLGIQDNVTAHAEAVVLPFTLTEHNNIVVHVVINETDTLQLMLHTASRGVTITEDAARKARSIQFSDASKVESWGGEAVSRISKGNQVHLGPIKTKNITIWENKHSGKGTDGKFGLDLLARSIVEIDFDHSQIVLHEKLPSKAEKCEKLKIDKQDGQLLIEGKCVLEGKSYTNQFLLHTGYSGGILLDDAFAARTGVEARIRITEHSSLKDSFGNTIQVKKGILPIFTLGRIQLNEVPVGFFKGVVGKQKLSVLGAEVIKRLNLIFDLAKHELYIARRENILK